MWSFKLFNGVKEDKEPIYLTQIRRPDYKGEFYFCSSCRTGCYKACRCPECVTATRKKGRNIGNGDKPRVSLDFEGE